MKLSAVLPEPVGRAAFLSLEAEAQLVGPGESLVSQLSRLLQGMEPELRTLLGMQADLPPRAPLPWTLLTEGEHPGWPLLALSDPPALPAAAAARLVTHLATAYQVMPAAQRRQWAERNTPAQPETPSWARLLAELAVAQAVPALLGFWGVLSACVGLNVRHRPQAAALLEAELLRLGTELTQPGPLAAAAAWSALWPLHGGLPFPGRAEVIRVAQALRAPRPQPSPLPDEPQLQKWLTGQLPQLSEEALGQLAAQLHGRHPTLGQDPSSGICLSCEPGAVAYWLRRRREVQLVTCSGPEAKVGNWVWSVGH